MFETCIKDGAGRIKFLEMTKMWQSWNTKIKAFSEKSVKFDDFFFKSSAIFRFFLVELAKMKGKSTLSHFGKPCRCLHFRRLEVIIIVIFIHLDAPQQCKTCFEQFLCFLPESKCSSCLCNKKHDIYNNLSVFCQGRSHTSQNSRHRFDQRGSSALGDALQWHSF